MFHFMFVLILLVQFGLLSGPFWEIAARPVSNLFSLYLSICNIYLFPTLVLRAGFAFCLLQFLFIAVLLLL